MSTSPPPIEFSDVTVRLGGRVVIENVDARVEPGAVAALVGPNGAGKTTLISAILGLVPFDGGIDFGGRRPRIGLVPQRIEVDRGAPVAVADLIAASTTRRPLWSSSGRRLARAVEPHLERVGLSGYATRPLGKLSGGELQRVLLARALAIDPELLLLDEPDAGLDATGEALLCELLTRWQRERAMTVLMVSHDLPVVSAHADFVMCLRRGLVCAGRPPDVLTPETLTALFGAHLALHEAER